MPPAARFDKIDAQHSSGVRGAPVPLTSTSPALQRAVVAWAEVRGSSDGWSVLQLIERPSLMTEHSLLYQCDGTSLAIRFSGAGITDLHRTVAEGLLQGTLPASPMARVHALASHHTLLSVVLPFIEHGGFVIVLFDHGCRIETA